jgi:hypothetical protein
MTEIQLADTDVEVEFQRNRSDKIEFYNRIRSIQEWILAGVPVSDIYMNISRNWNVCDRQAKRYVKEARVLFIEQCHSEIEEKKAFHIAARMKLYETALKNKDVKNSLAVLKDIAELEGLYVQKIEHSGKVDSDNKHEVIFKKFSENDNTSI